MTNPASLTADPKTLNFDRRIAYGCLGMGCGLVMGLMLWCFDLIIGSHHAVIPITLRLMAIEGGIGFAVASGDKNKLDDVVSFIIAFFIVP